ncbi:MAG: hypothetical protein CMF76_06025 [Maricaulis sp.]|nr:hypothetical protein [Maricaulis sp.]
MQRVSACMHVELVELRDRGRQEEKRQSQSPHPGVMVAGQEQERGKDRNSGRHRADHDLQEVQR